MSHSHKKNFAPKNPWHLVWIVLVAVVVLTAIMNVIHSFLWYGKISRDLMIIGTIDAAILSLLITPVVIKLILEEQQRIKDELRSLALTDDLTELTNRRGFYLLAEQLLKIAHRTNDGLYLMYIDLDNFKQINDTHGHAEGDFALREFARLLKENYRDSDIVARIGGDEFVLLPVGTSKDGIGIIRNRFYKVLADFNSSHENPWILSATIGLAYFDSEAPCSLDELLKQADKALYEHKKSNIS